MNTVSILGLGYIGLPTALIAAQYGYTVYGYDVDSSRVDRINNYDPVIQEPELFDKLGIALASGRFKASTTLESADYYIIAVPTPFKENKKADLSFVWKAVTTLSTVLQKGSVIILESTVPVGTTDQLAAFLATKTGLVAGKDFFIAHCPERVLPGRIFTELIHNSRIIGGITPRCFEKAAEFYKKFVTGQLYLTNATAAEMVKLVENSSRDTQIAFANQVAAMAYQVGLDPYEIIELANKHPRVNILNPSCGVGGHCIAVDPWFLVETFPDHTTLLKAARLVNDNKPLQVVSTVRSAIQAWYKHHVQKPTVLVLGLTYKADIDDIRESPALLIAKKLQRYSDITLLINEPNIESTVIHDHFTEPLVSLEYGLEHADIVIALVNHSHYKPHLAALQEKRLLDFCGLLHTQTPLSTTQETVFWSANTVTVSQHYSKEISS